MIVAAACGVFVAAMVGMSYAAVPLYDWFCRATGFGGTHAGRDRGAAGRARPHHHGALRRQCRRRPAVALRAGAELDRGRASARSSPSTTSRTNLAARETVGQAAYNVAPATTGIYFQKINCFCFTEQRLGPGEKREMPVVFYVDPALAKDRRAGRPQHDHAVLHVLCGARAGPAGRGSRRRTARDELNARAQARETETETMADAHAKHHDYHLVDPSPWPIVGSVAALRARGRADRLDAQDVRRGAAGVRGRRARRALHDGRPGGATSSTRPSTRATTPAWCRSRTATA